MLLIRILSNNIVIIHNCKRVHCYYYNFNFSRRFGIKTQALTNKIFCFLFEPINKGNSKKSITKFSRQFASFLLHLLSYCQLKIHVLKYAKPVKVY